MKKDNFEIEMTENDNTNKNRTSFFESVLKSAKVITATANIPFISPLLSEVIGLKLSKLGEQRLVEFSEKVDFILQRLPAEVLESDKFVLATELALRNIYSEYSVAKRNRLIKIYIEFVNKISVSAETSLEELEMWLRSTKELSDGAFKMLLVMREAGLIGSPYEYHDDLGKRNMLFTKLIDEHEIREYSDTYLAELERTGLAVSSSAFWTSGQRYITTAGIKFLQWLEV